MIQVSSSFFKYTFVYIKKLDETWIIAEARYQNLLEDKLGLSSSDYEITDAKSGSEFNNKWSASRPFQNTIGLKQSMCIVDNSVSDSEGTGIVHIAPGHGDIDYTVGHLYYDLPVISPVDDAGKHTDEAGHNEIKGLFVMSKGNA